MTAAWPTELRLSSDKRTLTVSFDNGETHAFPAEYLRVCSPSAEVQGHGPGQKKTVPGKRNVLIYQVEPVGNYAVRLHFDDMHDTGIFTWSYFLELAHEEDRHWGTYLRELEEKGLSRDR
ncbi:MULTISPECIES: gamma-butyrobetaine hydroxylase-like domain-containing protein [Pannonibacter]|jgi:DUF971 family protein|uniref:Uncharacterized protein conserved in bacteria n=2 Tax=Pannonibacter TaxID=227873 RepID=A0A378ZRD3_9HYPH|nr:MULTISPECIES: DUF971 domain-containing protein [Pannonibacter]CUA94468.1 Uncharacterized conserved protein, DUF971 family [Pannonibacter indicus]SUA99774.1 Uncharacterized protein conserved in bacteria [Pannonibacter phragmitetus]